MQTNQLSRALLDGRRGHFRCLPAALAALAAPALLLTVASGAPAAELTADSPTVASTVTGAIVDIVSTETFKDLTAAGTGMILTPSGEILTNNHVINGATSIEVTVVGTGRSYRATVVGTDPTHDVAVIQLVGASGLRTTPIGDSRAVTVGQSVVARGNGEGAGGQPNVARGRVIALDRSITAADEGSTDSEMLSGLIETDAPIVPGDSGGPLATTAGQVIGMDTAASTSSGSTRGGPAGPTRAFAIPIRSALTIVSQIENGQASSTVHLGLHGFLGIALRQSSGFRSRGAGGGRGAAGVRIAGVIAASAAQQAGLVAGDLITSVDGQPVDGATILNQILTGTKAGQTVTIGWTDANGQTRTGTTKLQAAAAD